MPILHWLTRENDLKISSPAPYRLLDHVDAYGNDEKFYPDFVTQFEDGRALVIEYKGAHFVDLPIPKKNRTSANCGQRKAVAKTSS